MLATWVALFLPMTGWANPDADSLSLDEETFYQIYLDYVDSLESTFHYETGLITLGDDLATIRVPEGYQYLNPSDSRKVLEDIWATRPIRRETSACYSRWHSS